MLAEIVAEVDVLKTVFGQGFKREVRGAGSNFQRHRERMLKFERRSRGRKSNMKK